MRSVKVYTANIGEKDIPRDDIECFSSYSHFKNPARNAKIYKVLPHLYMETDYSIWIDASIKLLISPEEIIDMMESDVMVFKHPTRDCIYDEAIECIKCELDHISTISNQACEYRKKGHKKNSGLAMCGFIARKHTEEVARMNERWWAEICRHSVRDQISFPIAFPTAQKLDSSLIEKVIKINDHLR